MIAEIKSINDGLVPICCNCSKIRHPHHDPFSKESWVSSEPYKSELHTSGLTHGICPDCCEILYPAEFESLQDSPFRN